MSTIDCSRLPFPCCSDPWLSLFPHAPHIAEELWSLLGNEGSIATVPFPVFEHLIESSKEYPVSFNGKCFTIELPLDLTKDQIEEIIMTKEQ
jgi:leucyl-tRNA synthetase